MIYNVQIRRFAHKRQRPSPRRRLAKSQALTKPNQTKQPLPIRITRSIRSAPPAATNPTAQTQAKSQRQHRKLVLTARKNRSFTPKTAKRRSKSRGSLQVSSSRAQCREQATSKNTQHEWHEPGKGFEERSAARGTTLHRLELAVSARRGSGRPRRSIGFGGRRWRWS